MREYGKYKRMPKPIRQDNKTYYSSGRHGGHDTPDHWFSPYSWDTRVPSLKRGRSTWKRFYKLFPKLKYMDTYMGNKLKKI